MSEFPADGILICPAAAEATLEKSENVWGSQPVVAFARRAPGLDYAGVNNSQGAELAIEHLYRAGHRRIAFLGGNPKFSTRAERLQGYQKAFARWKLKFDPLLVIPSTPNRLGGYEGLRRLLNATARALLFCGYYTAGGLDLRVENGRLRIAKEGKNRKFVTEVEHVTFSGRRARQLNQKVLYITERCVLQLEPEGLTVIEVAPGVDLARDVLQQADIPIRVSDTLKTMDARIFQPELFGLKLHPPV